MNEGPGRSAPYAGLGGQDPRVPPRATPPEPSSSTRPTAASSQSAAPAASAFVPLLLLGIAFAGWTVFQTVELAGERANLHAVRTAQQAQVDQSQRLRTALSSLASDTQRLADGGDAGAKQVIDRLHQNGITVNPNAAPVAPPPP